MLDQSTAFDMIDHSMLHDCLQYFFGVDIDKFLPY